MAFQAYRRTLARYLFVWVMVFAAGVCALLALRQFGQAMTQWAKGRAEVLEGVKLVERGDVITAQKRFLGILDQQPALAPTVQWKLGMDVLRMPLLDSALERKATLFASEYAKDDPAFLVKRALVQGNPEHIAEIERMYGPDLGTDGEAWLWLGRAALDSGHLERARSRFERYWTSRSSQRAATFQALAPGVSAGDAPDARAMVEALHRLFWTGLWDECFRAFEDARSANIAAPELLFYEGIRLELRDEPGAAEIAYQDLLEARPSHRVGSLRLKAISAQ